MRPLSSALASLAATFGAALVTGTATFATAVVLVTALTTLAGCQQVEKARDLDLALIAVSSEPRVRTDTVGEEPFAARSTFVLVDAENRGGEAAMVTLGGTFRDGTGEVIGTLAAESLWIPAGGKRLFALVDKARVPRPEAKGAQILVYGAKVAARPLIMHLEETSSFDDFGKQIARGTLVNDADRPGRAMVFAAFYDAQGRPMARPYSQVPIAAKSRLPITLVGPPGSRSALLFVGDIAY